MGEIRKMKLKHIRVKKYKLMRLYLAKYEAYKQKGSTSVISDSVLDRLEIGLKKVLFIIYQYHIYNRRILFIGLPHSTDKKFLNIKDNPHLIIIFNEEKLSNIIPECQKLYIPVIYFGSVNEELEGLTYLVEGNFVNRKIKNFFQFLIYSILKKQKLGKDLSKSIRKKVK